MVEVTDRIDVDRVAALAGLLDVDDVPDVGETLPALWHVGFFLARPRQRDLGTDGHPRTQEGVATAPAVRRRFAGGRAWMRPGLTVGFDHVARTDVVRTRSTTGRSGTLDFVTSRTEITAGGRPVLVEERDIVYLTGSAAAGRAPGERTGPRPTCPPPVGDPVRRVAVDPVLLFRFSALTFNAHRIHYDAPYAREVESYPGLVVHGPLQALLMADAGRALLEKGPLDISYQLVAPLCAGQGLTVHALTGAHDVRLTITDDTGRATATATVSAGR